MTFNVHPNEDVFTQLTLVSPFMFVNSAHTVNGLQAWYLEHVQSRQVADKN